MLSLAFSEVASLAESLAQSMADEVWMIEVSTNRIKNKQKQCFSLCIPSDEALAASPVQCDVPGATVTV